MGKPRRNRIRNKREQEITDLNKKISKKKSNLKQRYGVEVDVPKIDTSLTGRALAKAKEKARDFLNRNNINYQYVKNDKGVALPKKLVNEAKRLEKRINREKAKASKKLLKQPYTVNGEVVGTVKDYYNQLKHKKQDFIQIKLDLDWFDNVKGLENWLQSKSRTYQGDFIARQRTTYKNNYIQSLLNVFGDSTETRKLINQLEKMDIQDFYIKTMSEDLTKFGFIYSGDQLQQKWNALKNAWGKI